jgi:hypothetical protein
MRSTAARPEAPALTAVVVLAAATATAAATTAAATAVPQVLRVLENVVNQFLDLEVVHRLHLLERWCGSTGSARGRRARRASPVRDHPIRVAPRRLHIILT